MLASKLSALMSRQLAAGKQERGSLLRVKVSVGLIYLHVYKRKKKKQLRFSPSEKKRDIENLQNEKIYK